MLTVPCECPVSEITDDPQQYIHETLTLTPPPSCHGTHHPFSMSNNEFCAKHKTQQLCSKTW